MRTRRRTLSLLAAALLAVFVLPGVAGASPPQEAYVVTLAGDVWKIPDLCHHDDWEDWIHRCGPPAPSVDMWSPRRC
jgi:hypothetical protein